MTSADELRSEVTSNRRKLAEALSAAADRWEAGDEGEWSPRMVAEHCIWREFGLAGIASAALAERPADRRFTQTNDSDEGNEFSFATAADALAALEATGAASDHVFHGVTDRDLEKPAEFAANSAAARSLSV